MDARLLTPLAVAIAVPAAFALLRRLVPVAPGASGAGGPSLEALRARYQVWEAAALVPLFGFAAATGYLWYLALRGLAAWVAPAVGPDEYLLTPSPAYWGVGAIFLGIVSSYLPTALLYRRLLGPARYAEYVRYGNLRHGFDGARAFAGLAVVVAVGIGTGVALGLDSYARFGAGGVAINPALGAGETRYAYEDVLAVRSVARFQAPNGNLVARPHVVIDFRDGSRWTTRNGLHDPDPARDARLAAYVAAQAGLAVEAVDRLE